MRGTVCKARRQELLLCVLLPLLGVLMESVRVGCVYILMFVAYALTDFQRGDAAMVFTTLSYGKHQPRVALTSASMSMVPGNRVQAALRCCLAICVCTQEPIVFLMQVHGQLIYADGVFPFVCCPPCRCQSTCT